MAGDRIIEFEEEGVICILPEALDKVYIRREDLGVEHRGLLEARPVIRVTILDKRTDNPSKGNIIGTDITLIVYYNYDDKVRAQKAHKKNPEKVSPYPIIIIEDENKTVVPFGGSSVVHRTVSENKKWLGYVMVKMNRTGDPLISLGP